VDGQTAEEYGRDLESNLATLLGRFKAGTYVAPPVRRVLIPKGDGTKMRPIGIPTFEDKVLQRAVALVLEAVFEQSFRSGSYGFRPGRSAHQALRACRESLMGMTGGWVVEVDIQSFFDTLEHGQLRSFLDQRVRDGVVRRAIDKWLKAGILEGGSIKHPEEGTPQGGVISPLLANVYLHEVLDVWFEDVVAPRMRGRTSYVRYADDAVLIFELESDARRVMDVLPKRFGKYGLRLHPEKTRMVPFRRPRYPSELKGSADGSTPGTFDLLGFTHYWCRSQRGYWVIKQKTAKSRLRRAIRRAYEWCRNNRHRPVPEQHRILASKLRGHFGYFGITGNSRALQRLRHAIRRVWRQWLNSRSQRAEMSWDEFTSFLERYPLPAARIVHHLTRSESVS
jgi:group II intron reverse transcriptase/maturase